MRKIENMISMEPSKMFAWKGIIADINKGSYSPSKIKKMLASAGFDLVWDNEPDALQLRGALISAAQLSKPSIDQLNKDIFSPIGCEVSI